MNRKTAVSLCLLAAVGIAGPASSQQNATWTAPLAPFQIAPGVYWVGTAGLAAYLFTTPQGHILLDVGVPENAALVEKNIATLGFKPADVKILLNSHAHFDHSGGLAKLKADTGAQLVASEGDRYALEKGVYPGAEDRANLNFPPVKVDRVIKDGETVSLGGLTLTAHITPGHSPGCTSWGFPLRDQGRTYQALVFCSGSVALNRLAPDPQYPGIVEDYRRTFAKMKALKVDAYLAPHAEQFGMPAKREKLAAGGPNPFIDPAEKDRAIAAFETAFNAALAQQQQGRGQ